MPYARHLFDAKTGRLPEPSPRAAPGTPRPTRRRTRGEGGENAAPRAPLLLAKPAGVWLTDAAARPPAARLHGSLVYEGELTMLFATQNVGKSAYAVQLADSITRGVPFGPFDAPTPQPVLYLDFELSDRQFLRRYRDDDGAHHPFAPSLYRVEIAADSDVEGSWEDALFEDIERLVIEHGARVVIVDNITALKSQTQEAKDALPLMKALNDIKRRHGLALVVLAHTPKRRGAEPLTWTDLQGSSHIANLCDSIVAIGTMPTDAAGRYVKQIKCRSEEVEHGADNVLTYRLAKTGALLGFEHVGYADEASLLREPTEGERSVRDVEICALHADGHSMRAIGDRFGISHTQVRRVIEREQGAGGALERVPVERGTLERPVPPRSNVPPFHASPASGGTSWNGVERGVPTDATGDGAHDGPPLLPSPYVTGRRVRLDGELGRVHRVDTDGTIYVRTRPHARARRRG